ncbi:MAG TPA: hypothetical protein PLS23_05230, partial [Phycisphaerae bacterium]|nr:hypothetical protein [Phycisphaerae bacterium]
WFAARAARQAQTSIGLVALAFIQLHLAYGIGSLWGVLSAPFVFRRREGYQVPKAISEWRA